MIAAGDATGAIARRFAQGGYTACVTRRTADKLISLVDAIQADRGRAHGSGPDARVDADVLALVTKIEAEIGPIEVMVFNIGVNVRLGITETTERAYCKVWEMAAAAAAAAAPAGFLVGREAVRVMRPRGQGTMIFTGATASVRGGVGFCAFALLPAPNTRCARWPIAWRVNWGRRACMWPTSCSTVPQTPRHRVHRQQLPRA